MKKSAQDFLNTPVSTLNPNGADDLLMRVSRHIQEPGADYASLKKLLQDEAVHLPHLKYIGSDKKKPYMDLWTDLYFAAAEHHFPDIVKLLLENQLVDKNARCVNYGKCNVLEQLAACGDTQLYDMLVKMGVNENVRGEKYTPKELRTLFLPDSVEKIDWNKLYSYMDTSEHSVSDFMVYVQTVPALVSYMLYKNQDNPKKTFRSPFVTLLFAAVLENQLDVVAFLLENRLVHPNVQEVLYDKETPLHKAIRYRHDLIADELIKYGARSDIPNASGKTAQYFYNKQIKSHDLKVLDQLCRSLSDHDMLSAELKKWVESNYAFEKYQYIKPSFFQKMFKLKPKKQKSHFWNDIMMAAIKQHKNNIVAYLLRQKLVQPNTILKYFPADKAIGSSYNTFAHVAVYYGNIRAVGLLKKYGADIQMRNGRFLSPKGVLNCLKKKHKSLLQRQIGRSSEGIAENTDSVKQNAIDVNNLKVKYRSFLKQEKVLKEIQKTNPKPKKNKDVFLDHEAIMDKWRNMDNWLAQNYYMDPIEFLSIVASIRRYEKETPEQAALSLLDKTLLTCAENNLTYIFQYMIFTQMGNIDFLNKVITEQKILSPIWKRKKECLHSSADEAKNTCDLPSKADQKEASEHVIKSPDTGLLSQCKNRKSMAYE